MRARLVMGFGVGLIIAAPVFAASTQMTLEGPFSVTADQQNFDAGTNTTTYTGHVKIDTADFIMQTDSATIQRIDDGHAVLKTEGTLNMDSKHAQRP